MTPQASKVHVRSVARVQAEALASVRRSWRRMSSDFDASWPAVAGPVVAAVAQAQTEVATRAGRYVPAVLAETGQRVRDLEYEPLAGAWAGTAGDGRPVASLARGAVVQSKHAVAAGATTHQALRAGGLWLTKAMGTAIADTARGAEQMHMKSRRVAGYVRMLGGANPCGRCIILAGIWSTSSTAFERHPNCLCVQIPAAESLAGDLRTNPYSYLDSLDDKELARVLGSRANAQAFRDGADPIQLVNAYRRSGAVGKAQVLGREMLVTGSGTGRLGWARHTMGQAGVTGPRLMPASIYEIASNRAEAKRLLQVYGWI